MTPKPKFTTRLKKFLRAAPAPTPVVESVVESFPSQTVVLYETWSAKPPVHSTATSRPLTPITPHRIGTKAKYRG